MPVDEAERSREIEKSVIRKIMVGLVPFLAILYTFNLLDRGNVSIAALTMQKDLNFSNTIFGFGVSVFFIGYFLFEVPSNIIMEKFGARRWIARIMLTWGVISCCMMFMKSPVSFYSLRFLLGVAEAGFFPGIILYLTYWTPASVRAQVIARFLALTSFFSLIGGPLGGVLLRMNLYGGIKGWQWLFLLEGIPSILLGLVVWKVLPDRPADTRWLTDDEKKWIRDRLEIDNSNKERVHHSSLLASLSDPRVLHLCLIFILSATAGNAVGSFTPQMIKAKSSGLWSDSFVSFIGIIPGIVGAIAMVIGARHSDRTGKRRHHVVIGYFIAGLGYLACVYAPTAPMVLLGLSIYALGERVAAGSYWAMTTSLMGARAAAGGIAFINSVGNLGGFFGPNIMGFLLDKTHGGYSAGLWFATGAMVLTSFVSFLLRRHPQEHSEL